MADLAVDPDMAAGLLDESANNAQTEAGSLAALLGRKGRLKHLAQHIGRNALAGVSDGEHHIVADGDVRNLGGTILVECRVGRLDEQTAFKSDEVLAASASENKPLGDRRINRRWKFGWSRDKSPGLCNPGLVSALPFN